MAKITIEELFYGDKYGVMGEVVKQVFARRDEFVADPHTFRELEIVRQTFATMALENGMDTKTLSAMIGHIGPRPRSTYTVISPTPCNSKQP